MKKYEIYAFLVLLLGIGMMAYAGTKLIVTQHIYEEGNAAYEVLSDRVRQSAALEYMTPAAANTQIYIPKLTINFKALRAINKDAVAWLYSPDTVIDYPVMQADDYSYYLDHLPDGAKNANGSLFIDYNNAADFSDQLTVIYGHSMKSKRMFGSLSGYKEQSYYENNPFMYLYTEERNYRIELIFGCVIGAGQWRERAFMYAENIKALLAYAEHNTTFISNVKYEDDDKIVALSTCSYEFDDARYVLLGILR